jgi:hypothetical protein
VGSTGSDDLAESLLAHGDLESGVGEVALRGSARGEGEAHRAERQRGAVRRSGAGSLSGRYGAVTHPSTPGGFKRTTGPQLEFARCRCALVCALRRGTAHGARRGGETARRTDEYSKLCVTYHVG